MPHQTTGPSYPGLPRTAILREVGLRDGLQSISSVLPTAAKLQWIEHAYAAGLREIEVGSFVPANYSRNSLTPPSSCALQRACPD